MNLRKFLFNLLLLNGLALTTTACQLALPAASTSTPSTTPTHTPTATITPTPTATALPPNLLTASSCSSINTLARIGKGEINQMVYSPDGSFLLIASAGGIELYDAKQDKQLWSSVTQNDISQIAINIDTEKIIAIDKENTIHLIEMKTGKLLNSAGQGKDSKYMAVALSSDGKTAAGAGFDGVVYQYDTENFGQTGIAINGPGTSSGAMFGDMLYLFMHYSPKSKYIAIATLRAEVDIYDVKSGKLVKKIDPLDPDYEKRIFPNHLVFSQDEKAIAIDYENGQTVVTKIVGNQAGKTLEGNLPALSKDATIAAVKTSKGIELFETVSGNLIDSLPETSSAFSNSVFSPDGEKLVVVMPGKTLFWDIKKHTVTQTIKTTYTDYQTMAISQDGQSLAAAGTQQQVELYHLQSSDHQVLELEHPVQFMKFAASDSTLIAAGSTWLSVLDTKQASITKKIKLSENIQGMDVSPDGQVIVVLTIDNELLLYTLPGSNEKKISEASQKITSAVFVDNTHILALDEKNQLYISTLENAAFANIQKVDDLSTITPGQNPMIAFAITDSQGTRNISIYDAAKREVVKDPLEYKSMFAISPVNNIVAIPDSLESTLTLLDIHQISNACQIKDFNITPKQIQFSSDGQYLFTIGNNGSIYIFALNVQGSNG